MLVPQRLGPLIADGRVSVLVRRWRTAQVRAGREYRTAAGLLAVDAVDVVTEEQLTGEDARRAGFADRVALLADLRGDPGLPVYRLRVRPAGHADPRDELAADADLSPRDVVAITARLERLDRASSYGAWTGPTLRIIRDRPAVRAADLAESLGRERAPFKLDVRKLKALGLTISLEVGYRLSPRGEAYLNAVPRRADNGL
ncbi:MAG TPA: hypothetical protein VHC49_19245 [Mycobacteriales bacterium]|nr:hypothetical protein [Mycobacteriales bacterium]